MRGGCNVIDGVGGNRIANDINYYLIAMWYFLIYFGWKPYKINRDYYNFVKDNKEICDPHIVGWVGFNCSYSGKFFGGFAGETKTKNGSIRDYQSEAIGNVLAQVDNLFGVCFKNVSYTDLYIPDNSIVYCDPPYFGTTGYGKDFDHNEFWEWVRQLNKIGHSVFVSEYNAPDDFVCVWQKEMNSSLSANGVRGGNKTSVEKLFVFGGR